MLSIFRLLKKCLFIFQAFVIKSSRWGFLQLFMFHICMLDTPFEMLVSGI